MSQTLQLRTDSAVWAMCYHVLRAHWETVCFCNISSSLGFWWRWSPLTHSTLVLRTTCRPAKSTSKGASLVAAMRGEQKPKRHGSRVLIFHHFAGHVYITKQNPNCKQFNKKVSANAGNLADFGSGYISLPNGISIKLIPEGMKRARNAKREVSLLRLLSFAHRHVCHISADLSIDLLGWCSDSNFWWIGKGPHGFSRDFQAMNIINSINSYKINQLSLLILLCQLRNVATVLPPWPQVVWRNLDDDCLLKLPDFLNDLQYVVPLEVCIAALLVSW